jgi:hypothetical protein
MRRIGSRRDPSNGRSKRILIDGLIILIPIPFTKNLISKTTIFII